MNIFRKLFSTGQDSSSTRVQAQTEDKHTCLLRIMEEKARIDVPAIAAEADADEAVVEKQLGYPTQWKELKRLLDSTSLELAQILRFSGEYLMDGQTCYFYNKWSGHRMIVAARARETADLVRMIILERFPNVRPRDLYENNGFAVFGALKILKPVVRKYPLDVKPESMVSRLARGAETPYDNDVLKKVFQAHVDACSGDVCKLKELRETCERGCGDNMTTLLFHGWFDIDHILEKRLAGMIDAVSGDEEKLREYIPFLKKQGLETIFTNTEAPIDRVNRHLANIGFRKQRQRDEAERVRIQAALEKTISQ